jgi:hypothetical protein
MQEENENSKNKKAVIINDELSSKKSGSKKSKSNVETCAESEDFLAEKKSKIEASKELSEDDDTIEDDDLIVNTTTTGAEEEDDEEDDEETNKSTKEADTSKNNGENTANGLKKKKKRKRSRLTLVKKSKIAKTTHDSPNNIPVNTNSTSKVANTSVTITNNDKDLAQCRTLLNELMRNDNAWPFLDKVNQDDYPNYYEVIKEPMDLNTIKSKLNMKPKQYETKEQFAYDCRLIFDNCEFFNEDKSEIGRAGHKLRAFFETKWVKLFD